MLIIRAATLHRRLKQLLQTHTHFDVATAWASRGKHLELLEVESSRRRLEVRAIVGIAGNATHPDALATLNRITHGDLRIVPNGNRLFHPKLYLFGRTADSTASQRAWIGSANFTRAAFGGHPEANEEIMVEIGPGGTVDALSAWFREQCGTTTKPASPWRTSSVDTPKTGRGIPRSERSGHSSLDRATPAQTSSEIVPGRLTSTI